MAQEERVNKVWKKPDLISPIPPTLAIISLLLVILYPVSTYHYFSSYELTLFGLLIQIVTLLAHVVIVIYWINILKFLYHYSKSYLTLSPEVRDGIVYIHWQRHGPQDMWANCYRYANELPVGPHEQGNQSNPARRLLRTQAESGVVEDGTVEKGKTGYYAFELQDPGNVVIMQKEASTWDFKTIAVHVPTKPRERSPEEKTREQIDGVISSTRATYQKLEALDELERQMIKEVDASDLTPTEKERKKETIRRLVRDARARIMNISSG